MNDYNVHTPYLSEIPEPGNLRIMLKQHVGEPSKAVVTIGQKVSEGDVIAEPVQGKLGSVIHSPSDGMITHVSESFIKIANTR
ncbi:MAG: hypothetical protein HY965_03505 [Ignavibacteriales bacterium]|nr:hypothetical protein [Ignavibacteriales bacterium]